jgi:hypothetical protein
METVPNKGLIRFYEPLNKEVLVATGPEVLKEMFSLKPNDFGHPKNVQFLVGQITGSQLNVLSPHGHKVREAFHAIEEFRWCKRARAEPLLLPDLP